jgi:hypothetical protein
MSFIILLILMYVRAIGNIIWVHHHYKGKLSAFLLCQPLYFPFGFSILMTVSQILCDHLDEDGAIIVSVCDLIVEIFLIAQDIILGNMRRKKYLQ